MSGRRFRIIKGWYGTPSTPEEAVLAMRMGGRLGCVSALRLHGAWVPPGHGVHAVFPTSASGRRSAGREQGAGVVRHWSAKRDRTGSAFGVMPLDIAIILRGPRRVHHLIDHLELRPAVASESC